MNMMKKYLFMLAAFIAVAATFTACSSEEDAVSSAEQERGAVKTQFTISFPQKVSGTTRMDAGIVQVPVGDVVTFRGIKDIKLYPFKSVKTAINTSDNLLSPISLLAGTTVSGVGPSGTTANAIDNGALLSTSNSHLYQDVDIAIGTKAFMFYGEAAVPSTVTTIDPSVYGSLSKTFSTTLDGVSFKLEPINSSKTIGENGTAIATYMTNIAYAQTSDATEATPEKTWRGSENVGLQHLYQQFITIYNGSWTNVKAAVSTLYAAMADKDEDTDLTKSVKQAVRNAITSEISSGNTVTASGTTLTFPAMGNYPADNHLPDGAAYVLWQDVTKGTVTRKEFVALTEAGGTGLNMASLDSYAYPASLYYFGLSNILTSKKTKGTDVYTASNSWEDIKGSYTDADATTSGEGSSAVPTVTRETRSILIEDKVQYAVGRLDITVQAWKKKEGSTDAHSLSTIKDNVNTEFSVSNTQIFPITGILLSNQKAVDYKFETKSGTTAYILYDKEVGKKVGETDNRKFLTQLESGVIHTLALETEPATGTTSSDETGLVKIVVEFENNSGKNIVGFNNGIIYPGCKFYLIGTLDPRNTTDFNATSSLNQAIKQDYTTTARLKIENLKKAYNILPDLTMPKLEMGLGVDLSWQTGIDINVYVE